MRRFSPRLFGLPGFLGTLGTLGMLLICFGAAPAKPAAMDDKALRAMLAKIEKALSPNNMQGLYEFKNTRTDGTTNIYKTRIQSRDTDHAHITFVEPAREKGREVLRRGDELWTFMPSVGKVVKIQDRDSFAGGDFSNADVLRVDWLNRYKPALSKETDKQYIVDLAASSPDATYAQMRLWVKKETGQPVQQEFFDSNGTLLKRLRYGDVKSFGALTRPALLVMENVITKQTSELRVVEIEIVADLPDSRFVVDNMGK